MLRIMSIVLKLIPIVPALLNLAATFAATLSAWYWYWSSRVEVRPTWGAGGEPGDPQAAQASWLEGMLKASEKSAILNKSAAWWAAIAAGALAVKQLIEVLWTVR